LPGAPGLDFETWDTTNLKIKLHLLPKAAAPPQVVETTNLVRADSERLPHRRWQVAATILNETPWMPLTDNSI
jgi:hypothetical protein